MKKLVIYAALVAALLACSDKGKESSLIGTSEMEVVDQYLKAMDSGDLEKAASFLTDGYMEYGPAVADSVSGTESMRQWATNLENVYKSIKYDRVARRYMVVGIGESDNPAVIGNWVLEWGNMTVNYKDGGPSATFWWHGAFRMSGDKIDLLRKFYDRADIMQQRGYTFSKEKD